MVTFEDADCIWVFCTNHRMRLFHQEALETIVILQSAFKCIHKIGISLCNSSFCLFAPYLFFLWPLFLLAKLISFFFLTKKKIKTLFFFPLRLLIARKIFQFYDIKVSFNNVRFPTYSVLHSPMLLNIAIKVYTVHFTFFSFCPDNSWLHL